MILRRVMEHVKAQNWLAVGINARAYYTQHAICDEGKDDDNSGSRGDR